MRFGASNRRNVDVFELCLWQCGVDARLNSKRLVAAIYVVVSLVPGYLAIIVGDKLGGTSRRPVAVAAVGGDEG